VTICDCVWHLCSLILMCMCLCLCVFVCVDVNAVNARGETPLHWAIRSIRPNAPVDLIMILIENGADPSISAKSVSTLDIVQQCGNNLEIYAAVERGKV